MQAVMSLHVKVLLAQILVATIYSNQPMQPPNQPTLCGGVFGSYSVVPPAKTIDACNEPHPSLQCDDTRSLRHCGRLSPTQFVCHDDMSGLAPTSRTRSLWPPYPLGVTDWLQPLNEIGRSRRQRGGRRRRRKVARRGPRLHAQIAALWACIALAVVCAASSDIPLTLWAFATAACGVVWMACGIHFHRQVCTILSINFWLAAVWLCCSTGADRMLGINVILIAYNLRHSWMLFPEGDAAAAPLVAGSVPCLYCNFPSVPTQLIEVSQGLWSSVCGACNKLAYTCTLYVQSDPIGCPFLTPRFLPNAVWPLYVIKVWN
jgi:hypothetical protein